MKIRKIETNLISHYGYQRFSWQKNISNCIKILVTLTEYKHDHIFVNLVSVIY